MIVNELRGAPCNPQMAPHLRGMTATNAFRNFGTRARRAAAGQARKWGAGPRRPVDDAERRATVARLELLANLLDAAIVIPGTRVTFGIDALAGLVPGIGDVATGLVSLWIVKEAHRLGAPRDVVVKMVVNCAIDVLVGSVPVAGDVFDVLWRANIRNVALLREHFGLP